MTDLHQHLLVGIDDGANSMETAEKMLRLAQRQGIRRIAVTPHSHLGYKTIDPELCKLRFLELQSLCERVTPEIELILGMEIHYTSQTASALSCGALLPLGNSRYVLIELWESISWQEVRTAVEAILNTGYLPILAHVERYRCFLHAPRRALALKQDLPVCYQFNASFALDDRSISEHRFFTHMLSERGFDIMASDAHDVRYRPNRMKEAYRFLLDYIDNDYVRSLVSFSLV